MVHSKGDLASVSMARTSWWQNRLDMPLPREVIALTASRYYQDYLIGAEGDPRCLECAKEAGGRFSR
jgi:hypothetical protein